MLNSPRGDMQSPVAQRSHLATVSPEGLSDVE